MSHARWQRLRLHKIEKSLREFWQDELSSARTYRQYAEVTGREIPEEVATVVERILSGTLGDTAGALATLFTTRTRWAYENNEVNAIESLEARFRMYFAALTEHEML